MCGKCFRYKMCGTTGCTDWDGKILNYTFQLFSPKSRINHTMINVYYYKRITFIFDGRLVCHHCPQMWSKNDCVRTSGVHWGGIYFWKNIPPHLIIITPNKSICFYLLGVIKILFGWLGWGTVFFFFLTPHWFFRFCDILDDGCFFLLLKMKGKSDDG